METNNFLSYYNGGRTVDFFDLDRGNCVWAIINPIVIFFFGIGIKPIMNVKPLT